MSVENMVSDCKFFYLSWGSSYGLILNEMVEAHLKVAMSENVLALLLVESFLAIRVFAFVHLYCMISSFVHLEEEIFKSHLNRIA
jgi:hypothetical protein